MLVPAAIGARLQKAIGTASAKIHTAIRVSGEVATAGVLSGGDPVATIGQGMGGMHHGSHEPAPHDHVPAHEAPTPRAPVSGHLSPLETDPNPVSAGSVRAGAASSTTSGGLSGGKITQKDFLGTPATNAERVAAKAQAKSEREMTLDEQAASVTVGTARSERDMLLAIQYGEMPRFIARVGPADNFSRGTFANPNRPFSFATEPSDLRGLSPAEAMQKVGWTRDWIEPNIGKEIVIVCLDTKVAIANAKEYVNTVKLGRMGWSELKARALADPKFIVQAEEVGVPQSDLPGLFDLAARTPVGGKSAMGDPKQLAKLRDLIDRRYGANELYTGMGATMNEDGQLGGREVLLDPNGTGLKLTPNNHRTINLGILTQAQFDTLFRSPTRLGRQTVNNAERAPESRPHPTTQSLAVSRARDSPDE
jgi:hypothetical protein